MNHRRAYAQGYGIALALDAKRAKDDIRTMIFGKKLNERMGANAESHPAKHEVKRAEVAGKTGITGGPPTNKGSKVPAGKQPLILSKMSWPSSDAALWDVTVQTPSGRKTYQVEADSGNKAGDIVESRGYQVIMVMPTSGRITPSDPRWKKQNNRWPSSDRKKR